MNGADRARLSWSRPSLSWSLVLLSFLTAGMSRVAAAANEKPHYASGFASSLVHSAPDRVEADPWVVLWTQGRRERSLHVAHFSRGGSFVEEQLFEPTNGWPEAGAVWRDGHERTWFIVHAPVAGDHDLRHRRTLQVYAADARLLAAAPARDGDLIGLTADGGALLLFDDPVSGPRVLLVDPLSGRQSVALRPLRDEFGPVEEGCFAVDRAVRRTDDGSFYLVRGFPGTAVVRRYTAAGAPSESFRIPSWNGSYEVAITLDDWLFTASRGHVDRWSPDGSHFAWPLQEEVKDLVGRADGGAYALLTGGRRMAVLDPGGEISGPLPLRPPPAGTTWAERAAMQGSADALLQSDPEDWAALLSTTAAAGGVAWRRARRLALDAGAGAVDGALVAAAQWWWEGPLPELVRDLLKRDSAVVGEAITRHLEATPEDDFSVEVLTRLLVEDWQQPSSRFVILLQAHFFTDSTLGWWAKEAYSDPQQGMAPGDRFPAPPWMVEHHLADLAASEGRKQSSPPAQFFLAQIERTSAGLEALLASPQEPGHSNARAVILAFPGLLAAQDGDAYGSALSFLASRAATWAASANPSVAEAGGLLSVALGDGTAATWLIGHAARDEQLEGAAATALTLLARHHPPSRDPALARQVAATLLSNPSRLLPAVLPSFADGAPSEILAPAVARLGDPARSARDGDTLIDALLADPVWPRVPVASLVALAESGFTVTTSSSASRFRFLDALWRRLERRPDLQRRLEDGYAALFGPELDLSQELRTPFFTPLSIAPESGLSRRVPDAILERFIQQAPAQGSPLYCQLILRRLAAIAAVRGPWPGLADFVEQVLRSRPDMLMYLPQDEADRLLGSREADRLDLALP